MKGKTKGEDGENEDVRDEDVKDQCSALAPEMRRYVLMRREALGLEK
jgi:hypothetical protein